MAPPMRPSEVTIRPAGETDLAAADRVIRLAFGTAAGAPNPEEFFGDADTVRNRWRAPGTTVLVAETHGDIVGANVITRWGSFGFFGPFGIQPDLWDRGIAGTMMTAVTKCLDEGGIRLAGLYTLPGSPKHIGLYQRFGFRPQYLTAVMRKSMVFSRAPEIPPDITLYAGLSESEQADALKEIRLLTDNIYSGLDPSTEITAIEADHLGDTLLLRNGSRLAGFAACHLGPGTEAGSDTCYVKFAAARDDADAGRSFEKLLAGCGAYARGKGVSNLVAGVNTSRREAYDILLQNGFRTTLLGVAMLKPDIAGFNRPGVFVMDDWR